MKHFFVTFAILSVLLFCGCESADPQQEAPKQREDPALVKAREESKKFVREHEEEERRRHDLNTLQNDKDRVFPWREGRRSESLHERRDSSVFSLW